VHSLHFRAETRRESEIRTDASHLPSREARAELGPGPWRLGGVPDAGCLSGRLDDA
jgi:hypothetical protein